MLAEAEVHGASSMKETNPDGTDVVIVQGNSVDCPDALAKRVAVDGELRTWQSRTL